MAGWRFLSFAGDVLHVRLGDDFVTYACSDCSNCGKCYPKEQKCPTCGADIYMLDDACAACGAPITDEMRLVVKKKFMAERAKQREKVFELAQAAKKKREATQRKVVYPWDM